MRLYFFIPLLFASSVFSKSDVTIKTDASNLGVKGRFFNAPIKLGLETANWIYEEKVNGKRFMRDSGPLNGVVFSAKNMAPDSDLAWDVKVRYLTGSTTYDGGYSSGEKVKSKSKNTIREIKGHMGPVFGNSTGYVRPFIGLSSRVLKNPPDLPGSYEREATYLTAPLGVNFEVAQGAKSQVGLDIHYNYLLAAQTTSDLGDVAPGAPELTFRQKKGYGVGVDLNYQYKLSSFAIGISSYFKRWSFDDSEMDSFSYYDTSDSTYKTAYFLEPQNTTTMYGLNVFANF